MTDAPLPPRPPPAPPGLASRPPQATPRRRAALLVGLGLALALIAGVVTFAVSDRAGTDERRSGSDEAGPTALSLAFAEGETTRYRISIRVDAAVDLGARGQQPIDMDLTETVAWEVVSVDDEGIATVELTVEEIAGTVNGVDAPAGIPTQSLRFRITPDGRILSTSGIAFGATGGTGVGGFPGMDQLTPILPEGDVNPGDSWDKDFSQEIPFGDGKIRYTAHSTFEGYETVDGIEAAVITTTYEVPIDLTLDFAQIAKAFDGGSSRRARDRLAGLELSYGGSGEFSQRAWVDLDRREVLRCTSDGTFEMTLDMKGAPKEAEGFPLHGITVGGSFGLEVERL